MTDLDVAMKEIRSELGLDRNQERELYFLNTLFLLQPILFQLYFRHGNQIPEIGQAFEIVMAALYGQIDISLNSNDLPLPQTP